MNGRHRAINRKVAPVASPHVVWRGPTRLGIALLLVSLSLATQAQSPAMPVSQEPFADGTVWRLKLEISTKSWNLLQADSREFVPATLGEGTNQISRIGVKIKGSTGSRRGLDDKPSLTVDCERFIAGQRWQGLGRFHLNNSVEDPSFLHEKIGGELFRAANVPAPRVAHAWVELNGRNLGLYVLKEAFTEGFMARHFERADGNLYEAQAGGPCDVTDPLKRNLGRGVEDGSDLRRLAAAALEPDLNVRWASLGASLDLDRFVNFMALEILLGHRDGYCLARNNYRLYHDPRSNRFVFLPDGMDQLFGRPNARLRPQMAGIVASAVMETPAGRRMYQERLGNLSSNFFRGESLTNRVRDLTLKMSPFLDRKASKDLLQEAAGLCERIRQRGVEVARQLAAAEPSGPEFTNGVASLKGWRQVDVPAGGRLDEVTDAENGTCLRIQAGPTTSASWRSSIRLPRGTYRFEGLVRTDGVRPLGFGKNNGGFLDVRGGRISGVQPVPTNSGWTLAQVRFEVQQDEADVEMLCALRASGGSAWFRTSSLRLLRMEAGPKQP